MISSPHTRRCRRVEKLAKSVIWIFVIFTMAVLTGIILYVLVRGFYSEKEVYSEILAGAGESIIQTAAYPDEPFLFIVHNKVRTDNIDLQNLRLLYTKRRNYWGPVTGQNLRALPFILDTQMAVGKAARFFLLGEDGEFNKYTHTVQTPAEMIERVEASPGGVGMIPVSARDQLSGRRVKILQIDRIVFPINPSVKRIENNMQLGQLDQKLIQDLFEGRSTNWREVGGIDLPVVSVYPTSQLAAYTHLLDAICDAGHTLAPDAIEAAGLEEMLETIGTTPGAVGVACLNDLNEDEVTLLSLSHIERGANLDIHYILEAPAESGAWGGISTIILNTFFLILFTLLFSTPIGIMAAIYLVEYAKQNRFIRILRLGTETLAGIPSIVFGLFGFIFFVALLHMGIGFISAVLTITMMVLPTIIRTSEEALKAVPRSYREGSLALGATKLQTIFRVVLPAASPGILSGVILALGRTVGETAVLIYTLGSNYELVRGPSSSARVLSLHLYNMFAEAISFERCFATGTILIFIILLVNLVTTRLIGNLNKKSGRKD